MMASPVADRHQGAQGRSDAARYSLTWTSTEADDVTADIILDRDEAATYWESPRFGVYTLEWNKSAAVGATIYFDSFPPESGGWVINLPPDATSGEEDFTDHPSGCVMDPNRDSPGELVITTRDAADGEELHLSLRFKTKGIQKPAGTTTA